MVWQILDEDLLGFARYGAGGLRSGQTALAQPIREPGQVTIAIEWI